MGRLRNNWIEVIAIIVMFVAFYYLVAYYSLPNINRTCGSDSFWEYNPGYLDLLD